MLLAALVALPLVMPAHAGSPRGGKAPAGGAGRGGEAARSTDPAEPGGGTATDEGREKRGIKKGDALLGQRRNRAAARAFADEVKADPDAVAAWVGWATAQARLGKCGEALEKFWPYVYTRPFKVESALLAARCSARLGYFDDAVYFDAVALERNPESLRARNALVLDLDLAGDAVGRDMVLEQLVLVNPQRDSSWFAEAALAIRAGDLERFDVVSALWDRDARSDEEMLRLRAISWLDVDDPMTALAAMTEVKKVRRGAGARLIIAESKRRLGDTVGALGEFERKMLDKLTGMDADVIHARVLADLDRADEAEELLAPWVDAEDEEVLATRWYLARRAASGAARDTELARLAQSWEQQRRSPLRALEQLVPLPMR
jgi:tetratricopeptide (TPR) repeat protein